MKKIFLNLLLCNIVFLSCTDVGVNPPREEILFDRDWKFVRNDIPGYEEVTFDDSSWRTLDLPHDYSIEDIAGTESPFSPDAVGYTHVGFTVGGTAWYRKSFDAPASWKDKRLQLLFEGVYMNSDVWINGRHAGNHIYGYTPFLLDITDYIEIGKKNVIAVQVKNEGVNSRWYTGSGIYRHVWLKVLDNVHIAENGISVSTPEVVAGHALVSIASNVINESDKEQPVRLITEIIDADSIVVGRSESEQSLKSGQLYTFTQQISIQNPSLWSPDSPSLYNVKTTVIAKSVKDMKNTAFGVRTYKIDVVNGFVLNGIPMKLKGGNVHHDNGPLGSKAFNRAEERRVELLKKNGFNAVRCAHNPPSVAFLNACDRIGLLVIDEALDMWQKPKNPQDYHLYFEKDWQNVYRTMVERDRNHPSIIMWSIGNEVQAMESPETVEIAGQLGAFVHSIDSTRPVTAGVHGLTTSERRGFFATLDVSGVNYAIIDKEDKHPYLVERNPNMIMYGSESYALDAFDAWAAVEKYPYLIGDFIWTAIDYLGEASIGWLGYPNKKEHYPWNLAFTGDIDICGWKRPQSYYRDAFWNKDNITIAVHPPVPSFELPRNREVWSRWHFDDIVFDWNWNGMERKPIAIDIYSSTNEVELFLNGRSLGRKPAGRENKNMASYLVPYEKGELKAIGYNANGTTVENVLHSSDDVDRIKVTSDRSLIKADGQDLCYVDIELLDQNGILNPKAENRLDFLVSGDASIVAVGNANPVSLESYTLPTRKAWRGKCLVIIRSGQNKGDVILTVKSPGLKDASVRIGVE
ncbi:MAG: DUF4982 domain-containing protein [Tannerella sp.]|jgi:beta-galactosidase|nr:DUF4982 domain-containing protein [Tannerella sp.]